MLFTVSIFVNPLKKLIHQKEESTNYAHSIVYRPKIINTILMYQLLYSCWIRIREKVQDTTGSGSTSLGETIIVPIKYSKNVLNVASFFPEPKV